MISSVNEKISDFNLRLGEIYSRVNSIIERTQPDQAAIESVFYSKNAQSVIKLSHARASAIVAIVNKNIPLTEYAARDIKKSVSGNGNASKEQIRFMIKTILNISDDITHFDTTDALAVAICHCNKHNIQVINSYNSWSEYINHNPEKIIKL